MKDHKHQKSYGQWAGNPKGNPPDTARCAEEIRPAGQWQFSQCSRKCGYGPNGVYCKQHAKRFTPMEYPVKDSGKGE